MDDAVRLDDVGDRHVRHAARLVAQHDHAAAPGRGQLAARDLGQHRLAAAGVDRLGERGAVHLAGDDVVGQHLRQRRLVLGLQQGVDRAGGQGGEGGVGRREHRERPRALQRLHQVGGLDGGDQRRVVLRVDGVVDDVLARVHRRAADHDLRQRRDGDGRDERRELRRR